jgi:predicted transcriptional regulator
MIQTTPFPQLREQAIALRRTGRSRREIKELLRITSNETLNQVLKGEPPLPQNVRPNAKDAERAKARDLRQQGLGYNQIAAELGVSKSSVSLWVRDLPRPEPLSYEECRRRAAEGVRRYWTAQRPVREAAREEVSAAAATQIGRLSDREVLIAGAIAYWCEGAKNKPYRRSDRVVFMNSDPALIGLFVRFLDVAGIPRERLIYQVQIHETADVDTAQSFLAQGHRRPAWAVPAAGPQAPQPQNGAEERWRGLPRLPARRGPPQHRPVPEDRGLGRGRHGEPRRHEHP